MSIPEPVGKSDSTNQQSAPITGQTRLTASERKTQEAMSGHPPPSHVKGAFTGNIENQASIGPAAKAKPGFMKRITSAFKSTASAPKETKPLSEKLQAAYAAKVEGYIKAVNHTLLALKVAFEETRSELTLFSELKFEETNFGLSMQLKSGDEKINGQQVYRSLNSLLGMREDQVKFLKPLIANLKEKATADLRNVQNQQIEATLNSKVKLEKALEALTEMDAFLQGILDRKPLPKA